MARHFRYYDDWRSATLKCPQCGWTGTFEEGSIEYYRELMDCSCPVCDWLSAPMLAIVSYPTVEESEANWDKVGEVDKAGIIAHKRFLAEWEAHRLKSEAELPDLEGSSLVLSWDVVTEGSDHFTVIRHEEREIWREPALYEGFERFEELVKILIGKYGTRLVDVVPTPASEYYLYGDAFRAPDVVKKVRTSIRTRCK